MGPNATAILAAGLAVLVALVAAALLWGATEKRLAAGRRGRMSGVYGKSFMDLPHAPLQSPVLQRSAAGAPPPPHFQPSQVAGASFAHLFSH
jgi:hypothetical protein